MKTRSADTGHRVGTRNDCSRRGDEVARMRQELPWDRIEKDYQFETDEGNGSLPDLFRGGSQLLVYHLMFGHDYTAACPSCSAIADRFNGIQIHTVDNGEPEFGILFMREDTLAIRVGSLQVPGLCVNSNPAYAWKFANIRRDQYSLRDP